MYIDYPQMYAKYFSLASPKVRSARLLLLLDMTIFKIPSNRLLFPAVHTRKFQSQLCCPSDLLHRFLIDDFEKTLSAGHSDSDSKEREFDRTVGFYEWKRGDNGYMMKSQVTLSIEDAPTLWNSKVQRLKEHIFTKRQQQSKISYLKANIKVNEVLIHLDYSENYKSQDQNEIQSAYFGQASFSLFTACHYYRCSETSKIKTMPTTITSEASDKSRMASITCVKK